MSEVILKDGNLATAVKLVRERIKNMDESGQIDPEALPVVYSIVDMVATCVRKAGNIDDQLTRIANTLESIERKMK